VAHMVGVGRRGGSLRSLTTAWVIVLALLMAAACTSTPPVTGTVPPLSATASSDSSLSTTGPLTSSPPSASETSGTVDSTALLTTASLTTTSLTATTSLDIPLPTDSSTVPNTGLSAQEAADRAAIEEVWRRFWDLYLIISRENPNDRAGLLAPIVDDPIRSEIIDGSAEADRQGVEAFGQIVLHPYWYRSIDGQPLAVIGDCRDTSGSGSKFAATGIIRSTGVANVNTVGAFRKGPDGVWHLYQVAFLTGVPCEPHQ
jgi:hypothetical protein